MIVVGLTGSIGMGKSTIAAQCKLLGAQTIGADTIVHRLLQKGGAAVPPVSQAFPEALENEAINRKKLGAIVFADNKKMQQLESILHPLVIKEEEKFARSVKCKGTKILVLDIPLLLETGGDKRMDLTLVATAPEFVQAQRVLARPNMTRQRFLSILAKQLPDKEKRKRADFIVHTGLGKAVSMRQIKILFHTLRSMT